MANLKDLKRRENEDDLPKELRGLDPWARDAGLHWRKHLPKTYRRLLWEGRLREVLTKQSDLAADEVDQAVRKSQQAQLPMLERARVVEEARRQAIKRYIILPGEDEDPTMRGAE